MIVWLYVDDLTVTGDMQNEIEQFKAEMKITFEMNDHGTISYFFGLEFIQTPHEILMHQKKYVCEVLKEVQYDGLQFSTYTTHGEFEIDRRVG